MAYQTVRIIYGKRTKLSYRIVQFRDGHYAWAYVSNMEMVISKRYISMYDAIKDVDRYEAKIMPNGGFSL